MKIPAFEAYPFEIRRLTDDEGGGFLIAWPDLPGCLSDGESIAEAIDNGRDAFSCWMQAHLEAGRPLPEPRSAPHLLDDLPEALQAGLLTEARAEGVTPRALLAAVVAEGLRQRSGLRT